MSAPNDPVPAWDGHTICHLPPGNPGNAHTISVGAPAVSAHLAHGDTLGPCGGGGGGGGGGGPGECLWEGETCPGTGCCAGLFCVQPDLTPCAEDAFSGCSCRVVLN